MSIAAEIWRQKQRELWMSVLGLCLTIAGVTMPFWTYVIGLSGPDVEGATSVLEVTGYTQVDPSDELHLFGCAGGDAYKTAFRAVAPSGHRVSGMVCRGWFKAATVRIDPIER